MGQTLPKPALRPFLPADAPVLAAIFAAAIEELTAEDYSEAQREAWASAADDEEKFGKRLAGELTLIATLQNSPVGFASLKGADHIDMLYVHPGATGQGVASMLCDALEKLAGGRGAKSLTVDASDNAQEFFVKRGYVARQRNTVTVNGEWLANTTMQKSLASDASKGGDTMSRERLYLFDTTLRDGAQTNGVDFTLHDKRLIAEMLDDLGIDYVEGGYPGANPTDTEFFSQKPKLDHAIFTAFGMTRRPGRSASNDPGLAGLLEAKADAICFVAKSSAYQVRVALETTNEENLASIRDSVKAAKAAGREVMLDCEHFFDGYKENSGFALACAKAAYESGARWVVLCDTNGGTLQFAAAYYDFNHIVGKQNTYEPTQTGGQPLDFTAPPYLQKGNTVFDIRNTSDQTQNLFALASEYKELEALVEADYKVSPKYRLGFYADFVKNLGYNTTDVSARYGAYVAPRVKGYQSELSFGPI